MKKEEIIQGILDYLNNDKAKYAVMVSGPCVDDQYTCQMGTHGK